MLAFLRRCLFASDNRLRVILAKKQGLHQWANNVRSDVRPLYLNFECLYT